MKKNTNATAEFSVVIAKLSPVVAQGRPLKFNGYIAESQDKMDIRSSF